MVDFPQAKAIKWFSSLPLLIPIQLQLYKPPLAASNRIVCRAATEGRANSAKPSELKIVEREEAVKKRERGKGYAVRILLAGVNGRG